MATSTENVVVSGRRLRLTHPDKVVYPASGTTKADVIAYYVAIAPHLLPHVAGRILTRKRWVDGVGTAEQPGDVFFEKNLPDSAPSWIRSVVVDHREHTTTYPVFEDDAALAWAGQVGALELHVPQWRLDDDGLPLSPDRLVLDLDPGPGTGLPECVDVARTARGLLKDVGLEAMPVTSGSKGIHLYAALDGTHDSDYVNAFAHEVAKTLESQMPDLVVSSMRRSERQDRVLVDWSQNNGNKTTVAPYSLRGTLEPRVAVPRTWRELGPGLRHLTLDEVLARMKRRADPLAHLGHETGLRDDPDAPSSGTTARRGPRSESLDPAPSS
ncbi:non-homologous end-joining DNA ligase [Aeromicrobium sp. CFBP 8757]|uniref:non-homologous end-joining DNA ligase n=1 Tax=Aeromicrobium sp. CFBP 8757 TaxID=2775288 RepID=UPI00177C4588|nr:non-homologous end-joining DNA ligase [Aeromicrobium sp. CFBP 8757]MBD8608704.1 non-homologous end-joining DNA ligase [Aeromicrobium sp. CFBP 8757]